MRRNRDSAGQPAFCCRRLLALWAQRSCLGKLVVSEPSGSEKNGAHGGLLCGVTSRPLAQGHLTARQPAASSSTTNVRERVSRERVCACVHVSVC